MHLTIISFFAIVFSPALADLFGKYQFEFRKKYSSPKKYVQGMLMIKVVS